MPRPSLGWRIPAPAAVAEQLGWSGESRRLAKEAWGAAEPREPPRQSILPAAILHAPHRLLRSLSLAWRRLPFPRPLVRRPSNTFPLSGSEDGSQAKRRRQHHAEGLVNRQTAQRRKGQSALNELSQGVQTSEGGKGKVGQDERGGRVGGRRTCSACGIPPRRARWCLVPAQHPSGRRRSSAARRAAPPRPMMRPVAEPLLSRSCSGTAGGGGRGSAATRRQRGASKLGTPTGCRAQARCQSRTAARRGRSAPARPRRGVPPGARPPAASGGQRPVWREAPPSAKWGLQGSPKNQWHNR